MNRDQAYNFLYRMAEGISIMFGENCETVVHEYRDGEIWTQAIFNGHVSGRTVPTTMGIFGKPISIEEFEFERMQQNIVDQLVVQPSGKMIKSSTFFFAGEDYRFALGINYDITLMNQMKNALEGLTRSSGDLFRHLSAREESGIHLDNIFEACQSVLNKPVEQMTTADRRTMVRLLQERNFFNLQKSVPYTASRLGVSKYTIYKYLSEFKGE